MHGGPLSSCKVWWKSNDARQLRGQSVIFSLLLFFVNHAQQVNDARDILALLEQEIALVFVG